MSWVAPAIGTPVAPGTPFADYWYAPGSDRDR